ncbi:MAG TPA: hypothetical protein VIF15_03980 [Polyangiaceae bacterium]
MRLDLAVAVLCLAVTLAVAACTGNDSGAVPADAADAAVVDTGQAQVDSSLSGEDSGSDAGNLSDAFAGDCGAGVFGEPTDLSCTGLYADFASKTVASDVQAYVPGLALWSDGALKARWIYLPPGQKIDTSNMDGWTFPVGTKIWKEFSLPLADASPPTRIETRLLWKQAAGTWVRTTYRWSADGDAYATELTFGELDAGGTGYEVPPGSLCNSCHDGARDGVLGFEAVALALPSASGVTLQTLIAQGLLTTPPATPIGIPGNATEATALGWLHVNCGTACHNPDGEASSTRFFMRLDVSTLSSVQSTNAYATGWNQQTQGFTIPDAAVTYRLHACDVSSSCAYYRASRRTGPGTWSGVQMPPFDSHRVDEAGVAAVAAWLDEGCDAGAD